MLHRHGPAAGDDGHLQFVLDVFVDGLFRDDFRETRYQTFQEKVGVEDERFAVQIPDTAHIVEGVARLKTRPAGETLIADNFVKLHDLCDIRPVVAPGGFLKGFDAADQETGGIHRLVDDPDALAVQGLHVTFFRQKRHCPADGVAGTVVDLHQGVFGRKHLLVFIFFIFYF